MTTQILQSWWHHALQLLHAGFHPRLLSLQGAPRGRLDDDQQPEPLDGEKLVYRSLYRYDFVFHTDYRELPGINGSPVDLKPARAMDSPYVISDDDSGTVTVRKGHRVTRLDFNLQPGE